jgi:hypothetical protein
LAKRAAGASEDGEAADDGVEEDAFEAGIARLV